MFLRYNRMFILCAALFGAFALGCDGFILAEDAGVVPKDEDGGLAPTPDGGLPEIFPTDEPEHAVITQRSCKPILRHRPQGSVGQVEVAGEWSDWNPVSLQGPGDDGWYSIELEELEPGDYAYKILYDGQWEDAPPPWAYAKWLDGTENRNLRVGDCHKPLLQTKSVVFPGAGEVKVVIQVAMASSEAKVEPDSVVVYRGGEIVMDGISVDEETGEIQVHWTGLDTGKHSIRIEAADQNGVVAENQGHWIPLWIEEKPFSWDDGLMYFAFTDRFRNGDHDADPPFADPVDGVAEIANYLGGDFLGIIHALDEDYFTDLGVNTIWLSPVYENPEGGFLDRNEEHLFSGFHGYWPISPLDPETRFGDGEESSAGRLHELIAKAHAKGIRVLFDLVLNHVHEQHIYVAENPDWFEEGCICGYPDCDWDARALDCRFVPYLPDLNYRNHAVLNQVVEDTLQLVKTYDVDAIRIDAAKHMDHVIMRTLAKRIEREIEAGGAAPFYIVGETFTGGDGHGQIMDYVNDWELDGQFDFPLYWSIRDAFQGGSFRDLEAKVDQGAEAYGAALMSPFVGNHDVVRWSTQIAGNALGPFAFTEDLMAGGGDAVTQWDLINRMSMSLLFTLTQPGVPLIYYGDEIGLGGDGDPDNRRMMNFEPYLSANQGTLLERVQEIGKARASSMALRRGLRTQLWVDDDLLVYSLDAGDGDIAIVAMNKSESARSESIPVPHAELENVPLVGVVNPNRFWTINDGSLPLELNPWEYVVLSP
jgi:neopullulanase